MYSASAPNHPLQSSIMTPLAIHFMRMFIKAVVSYTNKKGQPQYAYQLVQGIRTPDNKVRHKLLLSLGTKWSLPKQQWPILVERIEDILSGQNSLFEYDAEIDRQARQIAESLRQRGWSAPTDVQTNLQTVDLDSIEHEPPRSSGAERICLHALRQLDFINLLESLNVSNKDAALCAALVIARMLHPGSERETLRWMLEDSAILEILELHDQLPPSLDKLYRLNDLLWKHRVALQRALFERERDLFSIAATVVFYDLTNVHYHGRADGELKCFGRSKQKRNDCPLISLGLALDAHGFPLHCEMLPGNVSECDTLQKMLNKLIKLPESAHSRPTVVMDAGIATEDNIEFLSKGSYDWVVVSRRGKPPVPQGKPHLQRTTSQGSKVCVWRLPPEDQDSAQKRADDDAKEVFLYIRSENKKAGDTSIVSRKRQLYEQKLQKLHQGLSKKYCTKRVGKVHEKIGRLKHEYSKVSQHYTVDVTEDDKGINATAVTWSYSSQRQKADDQAGSYVLRTSHANWSDDRIVKTYWSLTDMESTFRSMKSELALRPLWHQLNRRIQAHLFITVLAYHAVHTLRFQFRQHDIHWSWKSIRRRLRNWMRVTTTLKTKEHRTITNRQDVRPTADQARLAQALNMKAQLHRKRW